MAEAAGSGGGTEALTPPAVVMNDFGRLWDDIRLEALAAVERVGKSGWYVLGEEVKAFEHDLADEWGLAHAVTCASGLDALELALRSLGLRPGEKVLTTPLTAFATTLAIVRAGGVPLFCDTDDGGQLDLEGAEAALAAHPDTRFALPVHLYGHAVDAARLERLRNTVGVIVVEDCAQAIGARSHGRGVGSVGEASATSFYPTKNLGALGDGGAVLTDSADLAGTLRALRDYGQVAKYDHAHIGLNSRLDELHAAVLRDALLPRLGAFTERRQRLAARYRAGISNPLLRVLAPGDHARSVWHLFPIVVEGDPEDLRSFLAGEGIQAARHYPALCPDQPALGDVAHVVHGDLARARAIADHQVSLPVHPYMTDQEADLVIEACNRWRP